MCLWLIFFADLLVAAEAVGRVVGPTDASGFRSSRFVARVSVGLGIGAALEHSIHGVVVVPEHW